MSDWAIRNADLGDGRLHDVLLRGGRIAAVDEPIGGVDAIDARGGALIPGLHDHHIHLFATAARRSSIDLADVTDLSAVRGRLSAAAARAPAGTWLRATGCPAALAAVIDRHGLDSPVPAHPVRLGDRTGALWVLNSVAMARVGDDLPPGAERDAAGRPTGRIWREDRWLRSRVGAGPPSLGPVGAELARYGITALTDASVTTDASAAALLAEARRSGALPQRLTLMSGDALDAPEDGCFAIGPVKILLDERALPDFSDLCDKIGSARALGRNVAIHCVGAAELGLALAALDEAGVMPGDRIEHGSLIPEAAIPHLSEAGLTVVIQPSFVAEQGDRYRRDVDAGEQDDLYRIASLLRAGVRVTASSDAPYGSCDPWAGIEAAMMRRTCSGEILGAGECIDAATALGLYSGAAARTLKVRAGGKADLCLLSVPYDEMLRAPNAGHVAMTIIAGTIVHGAGAA